MWCISERKVSKHNSISHWQSHSQVTKVLCQAPRTRVSLHIQKLKLQASIKIKIEKIHKLMFTIQYRKDGGRAVAVAMLPLSLTKPITLLWPCGLVGEEEKKKYTKPRAKGRGASYWKITPQGSVGSSRKRTPPPVEYCLNQDNPVPNCPNSYASLHARRPTIQ